MPDVWFNEDFKPTILNYSEIKFKLCAQRSTVKAANRKLTSFMSFENITFTYRAFRV